MFRSLARSAALVAVLCLSAAAAVFSQEVAPVKYAMLVSVSSGDTRGNVRQLATDMLTKIAGRDPVSLQEPTAFQRFILLGTAPEIPVEIIVGVAGDVTSPVRSELEAIPAPGVRFMWYSQALSRASLDALLIQEARTNALADHYWPLHPGDSLSGFLPANFLPLFP